MTRLLALALLSALPSFAQDKPLFRDLSYDKALETAVGEGRVVMIDFFTTWCVPCKKLDETTWKHPEVVAWLHEKALSIRIDAEAEAELAKKYAISSYPTILFVKTDGAEIDRIVGFREAKDFLQEASELLAGRDAVTRARAKLTGADANKPILRLALARALAQRGRAEEALKELLWCWDEGLKADKSFVGVRSGLPRDIANLGRAHPAALDALRARREAAEKLLAGGASDTRTADDYVSLTRALREEARLVATWESLRDSNQPGAGHLLVDAFPLLVEARRYGDAAPHAVAMAERAFLRWTKAGDIAREHPELGTEFLKASRENTIDTATQAWEALLGDGRAEEAAKVKGRLVEQVPRGEAWAALVARAARAGKSEVASEVGAEGLKAVPEEDRPAIEKALAEAR